MEFTEQLEAFLKHEYNKNVSYHYIEEIEATRDMDELIAVVANLKSKCAGIKERAKAYINNALGI